MHTNVAAASAQLVHQAFVSGRQTQSAGGKQIDQPKLQAIVDAAAHRPGFDGTVKQAIADAFVASTRTGGADHAYVKLAALDGLPKVRPQTRTLPQLQAQQLQTLQPRTLSPQVPGPQPLPLVRIDVPTTTHLPVQPDVVTVTEGPSVSENDLRTRQGQQRWQPGQAVPYLAPSSSPTDVQNWGTRNWLASHITPTGSFR
jgi:hypothetical protein